MLDMIKNDNDEKMIHEIEQDIEEQIMPQISHIIENYKIVIENFLDEEVHRIYTIA